MRNSEVVRQAVERAILSFDPIRTGETDIQVEVENGLVALSGYVRTSMMKNVASQLASRVLDGRQLRNDLISDDDLEIAVAGAIEVVSDSYLAPVPIQVRALRGHCVLRGTVPSEGAKEEIERLAYRVPGVLEVANSLQVDPATIERLVAPKKATAGKRRGGGGAAGTATVGGKPVTAADLPEWALKPKEDWSRVDYQARAKAKMAFKRNEGPDPKELEQAGAVLRGGSAGAAVEEADVDVAPAAPAAAVEDAPAPAATSVPAASPPAPIVAVAEVPDLPSWAFRAKEQWSKEEFQAYARAKSAFKKGEGPDP
ncbi:MAG TPA: BON domain-containing protein, partial [Ardenticatenaceae bacterium]|nr:BON domain-containing protein [Ardenticatenaceae bacterium]